MQNIFDRSYSKKQIQRVLMSVKFEQITGMQISLALILGNEESVSVFSVAFVMSDYQKRIALQYSAVFSTVKRLQEGTI